MSIKQWHNMLHLIYEMNMLRELFSEGPSVFISLDRELKTSKYR